MIATRICLGILLLVGFAATGQGVKSEKAVPPVVIPRRDWGAAPPEESILKARPMGAIRHITIHHTESPSPDPIDEAERLRRIQRGHMVDDHQWGDIAYHFLIGPSGRIYKGRSTAFAAASGTVYLTPEEWTAAGQDGLGVTKAERPLVGGEPLTPPGATAGHLTICFIGNFATNLPTPAAREAMVRLVSDRLAACSLPLTDVLFHREVACWTDCPGQALYDWFRGPERKRGMFGEGFKLLRRD